MDFFGFFSEPEITEDMNREVSVDIESGIDDGYDSEEEYDPFENIYVGFRNFTKKVINRSREKIIKTREYVNENFPRTCEKVNEFTKKIGTVFQNIKSNFISFMNFGYNDTRVYPDNNENVSEADSEETQSLVENVEDNNQGMSISFVGFRNRLKRVFDNKEEEDMVIISRDDISSHGSDNEKDD